MYGMYGTHVYGLFDMLEFKLCCEILLLLNMVDIWINERLWSEHCLVPCSFSAYE